MYKVDFLHAGTYLLTLQIDDKILDERGQPIKTLKSQKLKEIQKLILCMQLRSYESYRLIM